MFEILKHRCKPACDSINMVDLLVVEARRLQQISVYCVAQLQCPRGGNLRQRISLLLFSIGTFSTGMASKAMFCLVISKYLLSCFSFTLNFFLIQLMTIRRQSLWRCILQAPGFMHTLKPMITASYQAQLSKALNAIKAQVLITRFGAYSHYPGSICKLA